MKKATTSKFSAIVTVLITAFCINSCADSSTDPLITEVPGILTTLDYYDVPGVSYAVIENGEIVKLQEFGYVSSVSSDSVHSETRFQASFLTQVLTTLLVLKNINEGTIGLGAEVNDLLENWQVPESQYTDENPVSVEGILRHNAGLNITAYEGYTVGSEFPTLLQILDGESPAINEGISVNIEPGTVYFSSGGFMILQQLLEEIEERPFEEIIQDQIFNTLGLEHSFFGEPEGLDSSEVAFAHDIYGSTAPDGFYVFPEYAAQGLWSTANDLAKVAVEIQNTLAGTSDTFASQSLMETAAIAGVDDIFGLGFQTLTVGDERYFGHVGLQDGYIAYMIAHTSSGDGAVILTNGNNGLYIVDFLLAEITTQYSWPGY